MAEQTHISWADHTWNPVIGCTKISPACDGCYAEQLMANRYGRVVWGKPGQRGTLSRTGEHTWHDPMRWNRKALAAGTRPFVFCSSLSDIFDKDWPLSWRKEAFAIMRATPALVYLLLTKRPQLIYDLTEIAGGLPPNVALGTTVEDQKRVDNVWHLVKAQRKLKPLFSFLSCEPLLECIEIPEEAFSSYDIMIPKILPDRKPDIGLSKDATMAVAIKAVGGTMHENDGIGWIITGGESKQGSHEPRPTHRAAFEFLQQQAEDHCIPFHHKQNGEYLPCSPGVDGADLVMPYSAAGPVRGKSYPPPMMMKRVGLKAAGRALNGKIYDARPEVPAL